MRRQMSGLVVVMAVAGCHDHGDLVPDAGKDAPPPTPAALRMTPPTADLGAANQGVTTPATTFTVTNTGESVSGTISAVASGADASMFHVQTTCSTLAGSGTCIVDVTFTSSTPGSHAANLVVSASPGGTVMAAMTAVGLSFPQLQIQPAAFAFPDQAVSTTSATQVFTVTNAGGAATDPLVVTLAGFDPGQFVKISDSCAGATLAPAASCNEAFAFHPTTTGAKTASLEVGANPGSNVSASLSGTGVNQALLTVAPSPHDFGAVSLCANSADVTFTFANTGTASTGALSAPVLGGVDAAQFAIVSQSCSGVTLLPNSGNSCDAVVRFSPSSPSTSVATLSAMATPGGAVVASLSGVGLAASGFVISPVMMDFGNANVGTTSAPATITVTNTCKTPTMALATALAGSNPGDFAFVAGQNSCQGAVLAPNTGSCTMQVVFTPGSTGAKSAGVTASNGAQPATAAVKGTGL